MATIRNFFWLGAKSNGPTLYIHHFWKGHRLRIDFILLEGLCGLCDSHKVARIEPRPTFGCYFTYGVVFFIAMFYQFLAFSWSPFISFIPSNVGYFMIISWRNSLHFMNPWFFQDDVVWSRGVQNKEISEHYCSLDRNWKTYDVTNMFLLSLNSSNGICFWSMSLGLIPMYIMVNR